MIHKLCIIKWDYLLWFIPLQHEMLRYFFTNIIPLIFIFTEIIYYFVCTYHQLACFLVLLNHTAYVLNNASLRHPTDTHVFLHIHCIHAEIHQQLVKVCLLKLRRISFSKQLVLISS